MRKAIGWLLVLAALGGAVWAWRALGARQGSAPVPTCRPSVGEFVITLPAEGTLQSDNALTVFNGEAGGKLAMIREDGAVVKVGDVFCQVEAREIEQRKIQVELSHKQAKEEISKTRESAQESFEAAKRQVEKAEKDLTLWEESNRVQIRQAEDQLRFDQAEAERLKLEYERTKRLADKGYLPGTDAEIAKATYDAQCFKVEQSVKDLALRRQEIASQLRQKQTAVEVAQRRAQVTGERIESQVEHARKRSEMAAKELEKVNKALSECVVRVPASGLVTLTSRWWGGGERRAARAGDQVWPGQRLGTVSGTAEMSVWCRINERNIGSIWRGQPAEIQFEALPARTFAGAVRTVSAAARDVRIEEDPNAQPQDRVFDIWVKVKQDRAGRLKPGLTGKLALIVKRLPRARFVPLEAVFERDGKSLVYVKAGERFVPRQVKVGERNEVAVVVRAGLKAGETVTLADPTRYRKEKKRA